MYNVHTRKIEKNAHVYSLLTEREVRGRWGREGGISHVIKATSCSPSSVVVKHWSGCFLQSSTVTCKGEFNTLPLVSRNGCMTPEPSVLAQHCILKWFPNASNSSSPNPKGENLPLANGTNPLLHISSPLFGLGFTTLWRKVVYIPQPPTIQYSDPLSLIPDHWWNHRYQWRSDCTTKALLYILSEPARCNLDLMAACVGCLLLYDFYCMPQTTIRCI